MLALADNTTSKDRVIQVHLLITLGRSDIEHFAIHAEPKALSMVHYARKHISF